MCCEISTSPVSDENLARHSNLALLCKSPERVSKRTLRQLEDERNELLLSAASVWEIAIKYSLGKLPLPSPPAEYIPEELNMTGTHPIAVQFSHAVCVARDCPFIIAIPSIAS